MQKTDCPTLHAQAMHFCCALQDWGAPLAVCVFYVQPDDIVWDVVDVEPRIDFCNIRLISIVPAALVVSQGEQLRQGGGACEPGILLRHLQIAMHCISVQPFRTQNQGQGLDADCSGWAVVGGRCRHPRATSKAGGPEGCARCCSRHAVPGWGLVQAEGTGPQCHSPQSTGSGCHGQPCPRQSTFLQRSTWQPSVHIRSFLEARWDDEELLSSAEI